MDQDIPVEVEVRYEGQWIAWDTDTRQVVGHGANLDEVVEAARDVSSAGHLIWYRHVLPKDTVLVGGVG
jgi:hypothetical protein